LQRESSLNKQNPNQLQQPANLTEILEGEEDPSAAKAKRRK